MAEFHFEVRTETHVLLTGSADLSGVDEARTEAAKRVGDLLKPVGGSGLAYGRDQRGWPRPARDPHLCDEDGRHDERQTGRIAEQQPGGRVGADRQGTAALRWNVCTVDFSTDLRRS